MAAPRLADPPAILVSVPLAATSSARWPKAVRSIGLKDLAPAKPNGEIQLRLFLLPLDVLPEIEPQTHEQGSSGPTQTKDVEGQCKGFFLVYGVSARVWGPRPHIWGYTVDAQTGTILGRQDQLRWRL